jgi:hypothetical protein
MPEVAGLVVRTAYRWLPAAAAASHAATAEVVGPVVMKPLQPGSLTRAPFGMTTSAGPRPDIRSWLRRFPVCSLLSLLGQALHRGGMTNSAARVRCWDLWEERNSRTLLSIA